MKLDIILEPYLSMCVPIGYVTAFPWGTVIGAGKQVSVFHEKRK